MRFAVIEGTREWTEPFNYAALPPERQACVEDVHAEAARRLKAIRVDEWRTREFITGRPMPEDIRHTALQIGFAAQAIARLSPVPADYASDVYWPRIWNAD